jgi:hypothetical protein
VRPALSAEQQLSSLSSLSTEQRRRLLALGGGDISRVVSVYLKEGGKIAEKRRLSMAEKASAAAPAPPAIRAVPLAVAGGTLGVQRPVVPPDGKAAAGAAGQNTEAGQRTEAGAAGGFVPKRRRTTDERAADERAAAAPDGAAPASPTAKKQRGSKPSRRKAKGKLPLNESQVMTPSPHFTITINSWRQHLSSWRHHFTSSHLIAIASPHPNASRRSARRRWATRRRPSSSSRGQARARCAPPVASDCTSKRGPMIINASTIQRWGVANTGRGASGARPRR